MQTKLHWLSQEIQLRDHFLCIDLLKGLENGHCNRLTGHHVSSCWGGSEGSHLHHGSPLKIYEKKHDRSERKGDEHIFFAKKTNICSKNALSHHFLVQKKRCSAFLLKELTQASPKSLGGHGRMENHHLGNTGVASGSSTTCRAIAVGTHLGTSTSAARCRKNGRLGGNCLTVKPQFFSQSFTIYTCVERIQKGGNSYHLLNGWYCYIWSSQQKGSLKKA